MNTRQVNVKTSLAIRGDQYNLRSVVCCEINSNAGINPPPIIGSSTLVMKHADYETTTSDNYLRYDPQSALDHNINPASVPAAISTSGPIAQIAGTPDPYE